MKRQTLQPCQVNTAILAPGPNVYFLLRLSSEPNTSPSPPSSSSWTRSPPASTSNRSSVSFSRSKRVPPAPGTGASSPPAFSAVPSVVMTAGKRS
ncbi:hypothetical protein CRUP_010301 [Coryphaenoides rupestris]|nr:hypothetical protein CRUP_010301 [Coryphaenoides rupestris]